MDQELGGQVNGLGYMQKWDPKIMCMQKWGANVGVTRSLFYAC